MARAKLEHHQRLDIFHLATGGVVPREEIRLRFGVDDEQIDDIVEKQQTVDLRREVVNARKRLQRAEAKARKDAKKQQERKSPTRPKVTTAGLRRAGVCKAPIDGGGGSQDPKGIGPLEIFKGRVSVHMLRILANPELLEQEGQRILAMCRI